GFGRIGMKPTGPAEGRGSDPEYARRPLEEIDRTGAGGLEGFEFSGGMEPRASDSGPLKPPGWSASGPPAQEEPGARADGPTADDPAAVENPAGPARAERSDPVASPRSSMRQRPERSRPAPEPVRATTTRSRAQGFGVPRPQQPAWERLGLEPDPF